MVYLVLGCIWVYHLHFRVQAGFGLCDLTFGLTKKQRFFAKWLWCFRPQVVKTRKTPLPLPWVGKVWALQMTRPEKFLGTGTASSKDSMLTTHWAKHYIRETKRLCAKKFLPNLLTLVSDSTAVSGLQIRFILLNLSMKKIWKLNVFIQI